MKKIVFLMVAFTMSLCFVSCEKKDNNVSSQSSEENSSSQANYMEEIIPNNGYIFQLFGYGRHLTFSDGKMIYPSNVRISDVGEISRLSQIINIPKTGWNDNSIEIKIGHGYVADNGSLDSYVRILIKEYIDRGAVGAYRVQYERWNPFTE